MIIRSIVQGIRIAQSSLAQMVSLTLSTGRDWGLPIEGLDELRGSFQSLPVINSMRAVTCPHQRAIAVLTQILNRLARIVDRRHRYPGRRRRG